MKILILLSLTTLAFSQSIDDLFKKTDKWSIETAKEVESLTTVKEKLEAKEKYCRKIYKEAYQLMDYVPYIKEPKDNQLLLNAAIRDYNLKFMVCHSMITNCMWNAQRDHVDVKLDEAMTALKVVDKMLPKNQKIVIKDYVIAQNKD
jgi:hypothetical protein